MSTQRRESECGQVIVLANRGPFRHERAADGSLSVQRSAGGLVTALEPLVKACSGTWVACAAGAADTDGADGPVGLDVRSTSSSYRLRHVCLSADEYRGYYYGFANEGLWPLCHNIHVQPVFRLGDFSAYRAANNRFAAAAADEARGASPLLLVQDYHLALAPHELRRRLPMSTIVTFWHVPWPTAGVFSNCPWARELLDGLLGSDIAGFQTSDDCENFLDCVERMWGTSVDRSNGTVTYRGQRTRVRAYPVGVEWNGSIARSTPPAHACRERVRRDLDLPSGVRLGIGIDRLDYTKGIVEKFLAIERLFERHPEHRERFTFVQVAEPSRECLPEYRKVRAQLAAIAGRVNARFGAGAYRPIVLRETHHEPSDVYRLYRAADLCYVGSLRDGMNLVGKEFASAREDERGVLVLSRFAGAARQLRAALVIDPHRLNAAADALARALTMSEGEQMHRMRSLRAVVARSDAAWWAGRLFDDSWAVNQARSAAMVMPFATARASASTARASA